MADGGRRRGHGLATKREEPRAELGVNLEAVAKARMKETCFNRTWQLNAVLCSRQRRHEGDFGF